ncbi:hypothetical protein M9Y10_040905 [Tritrichomonas musculus]|uniref:RING-type domain-containing protein n=1 Tax=Tritrichomonas musculus TaxID=1915356 RepID=A0ABR2K2Y0_9EUKA
MEDTFQPEKRLSLPLTDLVNVLSNSSQYSDALIYFEKNETSIEMEKTESKIEKDKSEDTKNDEENSSAEQKALPNSETENHEIQNDINSTFIQNINDKLLDKTNNQSVIDLTDKDLEITSPLNLTFDSSTIVKCRRIKIKNAKVILSNLNLVGSIFIESSQLKLDKCRIHDPPPYNENPTYDYLVNCNKNSQFIAENSEFYNSENFGLCADDGSLIRLNKCRIMNIRLFGVAITSFSTLYAFNTDFINISFENVYLDNQCSATCKDCNFDNSNKRAFNGCNKSSITIERCIIRNCKQGAIYACHCDKVLVFGTTISDLDYSAIYLDNTTAAIKRTIIERCNGNGINVAHNSKTLICQCTFKNTTYPAIAVCEKSFSLVQRCEINDSLMSGLIVRTRSQATIENCLITGSKTFGVCVSDSKGIIIRKTLLCRSEEAGVCVYNHSHVVVKDSYIIGPSKIGFNVFCGGVVSAVNTTIVGMIESCCWVHHAGSGSFLKTTVDFRMLKKHDDIFASIREIESQDKSDEEKSSANTEKDDDSSQSSIKSLISHGIDKNTQAGNERVGADTNLPNNDKQSISAFPAQIGDEIEKELKLSSNENDSMHSIDKLIKIETLRPVVFQRDLGKKFPLIIAKNSDADLPKYGLHATPPKCKLCGKDATDCYFCVCAHCVYCMNCWNSLGDKKPKTCELCSMTIESVVKPIECSASTDFETESQNDGKEAKRICAICYEYEVDSIIVPCGHTICHKCAEKWFETSSECPFCRENGSRSRRFVSYE